MHTKIFLIIHYSSPNPRWSSVSVQLMPGIQRCANQLLPYSHLFFHHADCVVICVAFRVIAAGEVSIRSLEREISMHICGYSARRGMFRLNPSPFDRCTGIATNTGEGDAADLKVVQNLPIEVRLNKVAFLDVGHALLQSPAEGPGLRHITED